MATKPEGDYPSRMHRGSTLELREQACTIIQKLSLSIETCYFTDIETYWIMSAIAEFADKAMDETFNRITKKGKAEDE